MAIRSARPEDYQELMQLYNGLVGSDRYSNHDNDSFSTVLSSGSNYIFVSDSGDRLTGFASCSIRTVVRYPRPIAELDELYVDPAARTQGIGRQLMAEVEKVAKQHNCHRLFIESQYQHVSAHKFYERLGYTNYGYHFYKDL